MTERLPAAKARHRILEAAERRLAERGPDGVLVQDIAGELQIVPATVLHHFGSRDGLLRELMRFGSRRLKERLEHLVEQAEPDLAALTHELFELYHARGYADLYAVLSKSGIGLSAGSAPTFEPLLARLGEAHGQSTAKQQRDLAYAVLMANLVAFAEALVGNRMRDAIGLKTDRAEREDFMHWVAELLSETVQRA